MLFNEDVHLHALCMVFVDRCFPSGEGNQAVEVWSSRVHSLCKHPFGRASFSNGWLAGELLGRPTPASRLYHSTRSSFSYRRLREDDSSAILVLYRNHRIPRSY